MDEGKEKDNWVCCDDVGMESHLTASWGDPIVMQRGLSEIEKEVGTKSILQDLAKQTVIQSESIDKIVQDEDMRK